MKSLMVAALTAMTVVSVAAQDTSSVTGTKGIERYVELLRSDLRTGKVELYTRTLGLSAKDSTAFWPLYREYDFKLSKIGDEVIKLLQDYAGVHDHLTNAMAEDLMKRNFKLRGDQLDLRKTYFKKISKATSPKVAALFFQMENQIQLLIEVQIASQTPLVK